MNINEIAKLAGVSRATVSRYLNNGYVSEEKKKNHQKSHRRNRISAIFSGTDATYKEDKTGRCNFAKD